MTYTPVYRKYGDRGKVKLYQEKSERHIHSVEHSIRQLSCDKGSLFLWGSSEPFHQGLRPALGLPHSISAGGNGGHMCSVTPWAPLSMEFSRQEY